MAVAPIIIKLSPKSSASSETRRAYKKLVVTNLQIIKLKNKFQYKVFLVLQNKTKSPIDKIRPIVKNVENI